MDTGSGLLHKIILEFTGALKPDKEVLHLENVLDSVHIFRQYDLIYTAVYSYAKTIFHKYGKETYLRKNMYLEFPVPVRTETGLFFPETDFCCRC